MIIAEGTLGAGWHCHMAVGVNQGLRAKVSRTSISNADLTYKFQQMLRTIGDCPPTVPVAIVPHANGEWSAVISTRLRREYPDCVKRIEAVERRLRGS
jgi:hypothetical protein